MKNVLESTLRSFDSYHGISTEQRWASTNLGRVITDLTDLPYKPGYGSEFRVEVLDDLGEPERWLLLKILFNLKNNGVWGWIVMVGYPRFPPALRLTSRPRCPIHRGPHPHVFSDGIICWPSLIKEWSEGSELYGDYIRVIIELLNKPREHLICD